MKTLLFVSALYFSFSTIYAQNFSEDQKIVPHDRYTEDYFGTSVAISGCIAMIGANISDFLETDFSNSERSGYVYVFKRSSDKWEEVQKIESPSNEEGGEFGCSVSISNSYAIIGAKKEDNNSILGDGDWKAGAAYIFEVSSVGEWILTQKIVASDIAKRDKFGSTVSISGSYAIVGSPSEDEDAEGVNELVGSGSAYIYEKNEDGEWVEVQKVVASDRAAGDAFGNSVCIYGQYAIVGAFYEQEDTSGENTFQGSGAAYIFKRDENGTWKQIQKIVGSDRSEGDNFGFSVSLSGNYAAIGAYRSNFDELGNNYMPFSGSVYIFKLEENGVWNQVQKIVSSDRDIYDSFGHSICISDNQIIVGTELKQYIEEGDWTLNYAGSAYVFKCDENGEWKQTKKLIASDRYSDDYFGCSVSISEDNVIIGARHEDENATGLNTIDNAGSAYIFNAVSNTSSNIHITKSRNSIVEIYPNPVSEYLHIKSEENTELHLTNQIGALILKIQMTESEMVLKVSGLPAGIYFLRVPIADSENVKKIIVAK